LPYFTDLVTWLFGFTFLAIGPIVGLISLLLLKKNQEKA